MTETLANGYLYDSTQRGLSNEYQHDMVQIIAKYFYDIVPRTKSSLSITRVNPFMPPDYCGIFLGKAYFGKLFEDRMSIGKHFITRLRARQSQEGPGRLAGLREPKIRQSRHHFRQARHFFPTILQCFSGELPKNSRSPMGLPESNFRQPERVVFRTYITREMGLCHLSSTVF